MYNKFLFFFLFLVLPSVVSAQREKIMLNGAWDFCVDSNKAGIQSKWFIKGLPTLKEQVTVPHTWNTVEKTAKYYGWGWYQRKISVPSNWKGTNMKVQFDAVYHDAIIWVNGKKAGEHKSAGYTKFFIDVSKLIESGKQNTITVLADNAFSAENIPYKNIFDWANDGGIIRSVSLLSTQRPRIDFIHVLAKPDLSTPALQGKGTASIKIKLSELENKNISKISYNIKVIETNQETANVVYDKKLNAKISNGEAVFNITFDNINRWHFEDPNLYKAQVSVAYNNLITDVDTVNFGFREFKVVEDKFVFNGEVIRTAGVEWMGGSSLKNGMAESKDEMRQSLEKLKYLNTMFTRFHFQQDDYVYDWCDKNGIMVQQEIPIWGHKTLLTDTIMPIAKYQLKQLIYNSYNHPSIVAWGVGNEVLGRDTMNIKGTKNLLSYTKNIDSFRLVNYVSNTLQHSRSEKNGNVRDATSYGDVMMYNDYHSTWYRQAEAGRGPLMDFIQSENRKMPLVISEFGLCEPENWGGDEKRVFEMINNYSVYESKSFIAGVIYFCMNDYRTHMGAGKYDYHSTRVHGVYDFLGNPKPSAEILRQSNCPIEVSGLNKSMDSDLNISLVSSSGFPSYTLQDYTLYWSKGLSNYITDGKAYKLPLLKPGKSLDIILPNFNIFSDKGVLTIVSKRGNVVYQKAIQL